MLKPRFTRKIFIPKLFAFLFCVFIVTSQRTTYADSKEDIGEDYRLKGYEEKQKGNFDEALAFYTKAVSLGVNNPAVYNDMGVLYEEAGYDNRAEESYLKAIQNDSHYLPAYSNLGYFYQRHQETEKAYAFFKKRFELSDPSDTWAQKAKEEMVKIHPEYRHVLAQKEAADLEKEIIHRNQEEFYRQMKMASGHFQKGQEYFDRGDFISAIREYNEALSITPKNPQILQAKVTAVKELSKKNMQAHYEKAMAMMAAGNTRSAKNEIQYMLSTIPNDYSAPQN